MASTEDRRGQIVLFESPGTGSYLLVVDSYRIKMSYGGDAPYHKLVVLDGRPELWSFSEAFVAGLKRIA